MDLSGLMQPAGGLKDQAEIKRRHGADMNRPGNPGG